MTHVGFTFNSEDGLDLLGRAWISKETSPRGIVHLVHGLGEHSGRYAHVGECLTEAGYTLAAFDLRGHGLSGGKRGHAPGIPVVMKDIARFLEESETRFGADLPRFLYGHSLGGSLVINYGLRRKPDLAGVIATSPALATAFAPPKAKVTLGKIMSNILPGLQMNNGLETTALSRDKAIVTAYQNDVLVHNKLSAQLGIDLLESGQFALDNATSWNMPLLLMHGTADRITSHKASKQFAKAAGDAVELVLWEDYYHETHNDLGKENVIKKMITWLDTRSAV